MKNITQQLYIPSLGKRSPISNWLVPNTRRAFYLTNLIIFFVILAIFGYVKYNQWQYERRIVKYGPLTKPNVIVISYTNLGPPPSITGNDLMTQSVSSAKTIANIGVPKPVPDALAVQETSPDQTVIAGPTIFDSNANQNIVVDTTLPSINAYIPHEVEPRLLYRPSLVYPSQAKSFGYEGATIIKALLDLDGSVMRIVVVKSAGYPILDSAAVNYIASARFSPALQQTKPVRVWIGQTINFQLKDR
jgi:TonB family protein